MSGLVLSHAFGNANVRAAIRAINKGGNLHEFWTSISWRDNGWLKSWIPSGLLRQLRRRAYPADIPIRTFPYFELGRHFFSGIGCQKLAGYEKGFFSILACHERLDARVARSLRPGLDGVYCYEHGGLETFRAAKSLGIRTIYEMSSGYWRALKAATEEAVQLWPEWGRTVPSQSFDNEIFLRRDQELALADRIVVASSFVAKTLNLAQLDHNVISVIPYGAPPSISELVLKQRLHSDRPLRLLYVGNLGLMKGLPYLLQSVERLGNKVELTLIGSRVGPTPQLNLALQKHRWIPTLPNAEVLAEMERHDVLVFPTLFDGFGLVILEALSRGMPVIATHNSGGPEVIEDGKSGYLIPAHSSDAIVLSLEKLIQDRALLWDMSQEALRAAATWSWDRYENKLLSILASM